MRAYTKTWSGVRLWCGVTFWSDFLEWDFGATFWSMIGLTKVISPMKRRCDLCDSKDIWNESQFHPLETIISVKNLQGLVKGRCTL